MVLAIIDSFARTDVAPKSGTRSSDDATGSFADILDTRLRQPEPAREPSRASETRDAPEARDASEPTEADQAPETAEAAPPKSDAATAKPRVKSKNEAADSNNESKAPGEPEAAPTPATKKAPTASSAAVIVAELLTPGTDTVTSETPMGLLVAAVVTPAHAQPAANAQVLSLLAEGGVPVVPPQAAPATPATPAQPSAATPATPATPVPAAGLTPELNAAAAEAAATPAPPAPAPATPAMPSEVIVETPAATAVVAAASAQAATPTKPATAAQTEDTSTEALLEALATDDNATPLATVTISGQAAAATAPVVAAPASYAAQLASQAPAANMPAAPTAAAPTEAEAIDAAALADQTVDLSDMQSDGPIEDGAALKPQDSPPAPVASEPASARAAASVEAVQRNSARPAAAPIVEQVAVRISKAIADGVDRISVKLNPVELGRIEIRMEIGPDGKFNAVFAADRPQTVDLLQRDARELARSLQDAGLRADTGSLSFNLRGQNQGQQNGAAPAGLHGLGLNGGDAFADETAPLPANLYGTANTANGRVDIRV